MDKLSFAMHSSAYSSLLSLLDTFLLSKKMSHCIPILAGYWITWRLYVVYIRAICNNLVTPDRTFVSLIAGVLVNRTSFAATCIKTKPRVWINISACRLHRGMA